MATYLQCLVTAPGVLLVENAIQWDGKAPLALPDHQLISADKAAPGAWIGWTRAKDGTWAAPLPVEQATPDDIALELVGVVDNGDGTSSVELSDGTSVYSVQAQGTDANAVPVPPQSARMTATAAAPVAAPAPRAMQGFASIRPLPLPQPAVPLLRRVHARMKSGSVYPKLLVGAPLIGGLGAAAWHFLR